MARGHKSPIQTRCLLRAVRTQVLPRGQLAALHRAEEEALPEGSDPLWKSSSSSSSKPSGINVLQRHSACFVEPSVFFALLPIIQDGMGLIVFLEHG